MSDMPEDNPAPKFNECDRLHSVAPFSQKIGEFIEWMRYEHGADFATSHVHSDECFVPGRHYRMCGLNKGELQPFRYSTEKLLAEFFEIDLEKVGDEKRQMLQQLQQERQ